MYFNIDTRGIRYNVKLVYHNEIVTTIVNQDQFLRIFDRWKYDLPIYFDGESFFESSYLYSNPYSSMAEKFICKIVDYETIPSFLFEDFIIASVVSVVVAAFLIFFTMFDSRFDNNLEDI